MERKPPKLPPCRAVHTRACTCCICPYGYPWWVCRTHPPPQDRYTRIHLPGRSHIQVFASMMRPGNSAPSVSVGVASTNEAVMAVSCDICSTTQRSLSSCSGSASGLPQQNSPHPENGHTPGGGPPWPPPDSAGPSAIPVTRPNRLDTVSDGLALLPLPVHLKTAAVNRVCLILPPLPV